ncbi:MAG TPA: hypothetical protein VNQ55_09470 [Parapedobacter sp.]|nr:hypothetical protein [Parapedobacter sp.]
MTKHLRALVRLVGRSYRMLTILVNHMEQFPLDRFITAVDLFIKWAEAQGVPTGSTTQSLPVDRHPPTAHVTEGKTHYEEHELMTVKEASASIPASRSKIFEWRKEGTLQTIERNSRSKRLIREEVEAMRTWARDKGKR